MAGVSCKVRIRSALQNSSQKVACNLSEGSAHGAGEGREAPKFKVQEHRNRLRARGLRPVQIWAPDVRASPFCSEAHRQSLAVAKSVHAAEDQAIIDTVRTMDGKIRATPPCGGVAVVGQQVKLVPPEAARCRVWHIFQWFQRP